MSGASRQDHGLRSYRFRAEREADWHRLEALLSRLERGSLRRLSDEDLITIPSLYRATLSALSVARSTSLDASLVEYLESLSARAYFVIYGTRNGLGRRLARFFVTDWPHAAQAMWRETLVAWLLIASGALLAWALMLADMDWFYAFVPSGLAGGRDPAATTEMLHNSIYGVHSCAHCGLFSAFLFTHNAQVAIGAFALGAVFCLPTALLLLYTGTTLGAFLTLFGSRGLGLGLGGWLAIHGVTELMAVALAGAAGLRIGLRIAAPGQYTRLHAAAIAGKQAATLVAGVFLMLGCAGLLEGIVRQLVVSDLQRYAIAGLSAVLWVTYLYAPRTR